MATDVPIRDDAIRLGQLLKLAGVVEDGATARSLIEAGQVLVDGQPETSRGRQVSPGTTVECSGQQLRVVRRQG